jgi:hypothetical protein
MEARTLLTGVLAGAAGTVAMTAHQELLQRLKASDDNGGSEPQGDPWQDAPAPAQAGKKVLEALGAAPLPPRAIPVLTQVMHWSYGSVWGAVYALLPGHQDCARARRGSLFGATVWAVSYAQLVPLGVYDKPWHYPPRAIAEEISYHLTYGTAVALAFSALRPRG